jgi:hypothetical protein
MVVAVGLLPGIVVGQGLGGAARKEADRRQHERRVGVEVLTYTDADLSDSEEGEDTDAAAGEAESGVAEAAPAALEPTGDNRWQVDHLREALDRAAERRKERERRWRARMAKARARVDAARREHDAVCNSSPFRLTGG